jgi:hypothetical protein
MKINEILLEADFSKRITTSKGKIDTTKWAEDKTLPHFTKNKTERNLCVYLVGNAEGLERHINDKIRLGFKDLSKHKIIDRDEATIKKLKAEQGRLAMTKPDIKQIEIIHTDLIKYAESFPPGSITHLDFDGVSYWDQDLEHNVVRLLKLNIPNIHVVIDTRNYAPEYLNKLYPDDGFTSRYWGKGRVMRSGTDGSGNQTSARVTSRTLDQPRAIVDRMSVLADTYGYTSHPFLQSTQTKSGIKTHYTYAGRKDASRMMMFVLNKK